MEWARADVFDAADDDPLSFDDLRVLPADRFATLSLRLLGATRLVTVGHALADFWDTVPVDAVPAVADGGAETLLVWRQGTAVYHRAVDARERQALQRLAEGTTLGALGDDVLAAMDSQQATAHAFGWLSTWTTDGLLVRPPSMSTDTAAG